MTTRFGVKYRTTQDGYTGGIADSYRLAAAYASAHGGTVYEVGSHDDPECATTKRAQVQEENFDDIC